MSLTLRQSFQVFTAIQLDRVRALVAKQTPPDLHTLPLPAAGLRREPESSDGLAIVGESTPPRHHFHGKGANVRQRRLQIHRTNRNNARAPKVVTVIWPDLFGSGEES